MDLKLNGKRAIITGGSKGIGLATAHSLAAEGCRLTLVARNGDTLREAADELVKAGYQQPECCEADLSTGQGVDTVSALDGPVDILVNNAGSNPPGGLTDLGRDEWRKAWDLKVYGFIDLCRAFHDRIAKSRGVIINIIGSAGEHFPPKYILGASGNAALMGFTRALGKGSTADGFRVVGINPGPVGTDRLQMLFRKQAEDKLGDPDRWRELVSGMPFGRVAEPAEIADAVAFLASPRSGYTSGCIVTIDGGIGG